MNIIDISHTLSETTAGFPMEAATEFTTICQIDESCPIQVSKMTLSSHAGTHIDAPCHYQKGHMSIEKLPLAPFIGACLVIDVRHIKTTILQVSHIKHLALKPRVLFKTQSSTPKHVSISKKCIHFLGKQGVTLIGIDTLSIDPLSSKTLPAHRASAEANIQIMENINLNDVPAGSYTLVGLPLKLKGLDASPIRAILLPEGALT